MRILVTGGAGYLGSVLTERLLRHYDVTVVDSFMHGVPSLAHLCREQTLEIIRADLTNGEVMQSLFSRKPWDIVIHLAALVGAPVCDRSKNQTYEVNVGVTTVLANALPDETLLIYPCSNSGYGIGGDAECDENSPLKPLTVYGKTKVWGEEVVMQRKNSVSLRLATLFGWSPRMRRDLLVNDMVWRAVRDRSVVLFEGGFRRNFCHVADAAAAIMHVMRNDRTCWGQIYNVGDSRANMTKLALCEKIQDHIPEFRFLTADHASDPDKRDYVVSNAKIEATGWHPTYTLSDGIEELMRGYEMLPRETLGNA